MRMRPSREPRPKAALHRHRDALAALAAAALVASCAGDGCSCLQAIPGGFPAQDRVPNAAQVRLSQTAFAALEADPAALVAALLGTGEALSIEIPPQCEGEVQVCCDGGTPTTPCGPFAIDLVAQEGDAPRLDVNAVPGQSRVDLTVRLRGNTGAELPIEALGINCGVQMDTRAGDDQSVQLGVQVGLSQHPESGTTQVSVLAADFTGLENDDVSIEGGIACDLADLDFVKGFVIDQVVGTVEGLVGDTLGEQLCKACPGGTVDECSSFADACEAGVCVNGDACEQELGLAGRLPAGQLLAGLSSGQLGALDVYEVAGGYADTEQGGISLGLLAGMLPAGEERDRCGPPSERPAPVTVQPSPFFAGNTRPDTGEAFDFALGLHAHQLDLLAWAAYESGALCANIGTSAVDLLTSDTLSAFIPSLVDLMHGRTSQLVVGLRPQSPPVIALGRNTFSGGSIEEPLLDISLPGAEIDFFAMVDDQFVRILTLAVDLRLPIGMEVDPDGGLLPVIGDVGDALTNLSVKNSEALLESPESLEEILPALLSVALPALGSALGPIDLPALGPLQIRLAPGGITAVEESSFLALYGNLAAAAPAARARRVDTQARVASVFAPAGAGLGRARGAAPRVVLALGGQGRALEWSYRLDRGMWSPYSRSPELAIERRALLLPGRHRIEVRAREVGRPETTDRTPAVVQPVLYAGVGVPAAQGGSPAGQVVQFHGQASDEGCDCRAGGSDGALGGLILVGLALFGLRRRRGAALLLLLALSPLGAGCSCGGSSDGGLECEDECEEGAVERGPTGRWSSIAVSGDRVVAAAYEESLGDLVVIELGGDEPAYTVVDGLPPDPVPTFSPDGYRSGVTEEGPDVGAYTSIALREGTAYVSYHDMTSGALVLARETGDGWVVSQVDAGDQARVGLYSSIAIGPDGAPAIAYMATGIAGEDGARLAQLRYAQANSAEPGPEDWEVTVLDEALVSCAGLCGEGDVCVQDGESERCAAPSSGCAEECGEDQACVADACVARVVDPPAYDLPAGLGLFASHVLLPDGRPVVVYHDRSLGDLVVQELGGGWEKAALDAEEGTDTGMFADAMVDSGGTVHVAYQDAVGDRLLYTTWNGTAGAVEVVDDGVRPGESRTHPVGASAALFTDSGGAIAIAYQDGATSDLLIARRGDGVWGRDDLLSGPHLDGFHITSGTGEGRSALASYQYDRSAYPPGVLQVVIDP